MRANHSVNAVFNPAFYIVVVEGYTLVEIGINITNPIGPQMANPTQKPIISSPFPSHMQITFSGSMIPENPNQPPTPQQFTFQFSMTFRDVSMFGATVTNVALNATFSAAGIQVANNATITLTPNPTPHIFHEDQTLTPQEPWYLSQDLKVFQVIESEQGKLGATLGTTGSTESIDTTFIQAAVTNLRTTLGPPKLILTTWYKTRRQRYSSFCQTIRLPEIRSTTLRSPGLDCAIPKMQQM